jgi:hypothetical protein|tara:strand:+ start:1414 stop:1521 length:108 start_codon:yes stop_codon:yes gene_type:complete
MKRTVKDMVAEAMKRQEAGVPAAEQPRKSENKKED